MYIIEYLESVVREDIPRLGSAKSRIKKAIEEKLTRKPIEFGKPLRYSLKGCRRLRVGDFRVIYKIDGETVLIVKIGHRKEVYDDLNEITSPSSTDLAPIWSRSPFSPLDGPHHPRLNSGTCAAEGVRTAIQVGVF